VPVKYITFLAISLSVVVLDHLSKAWAKGLELRSHVDVIDGFWRFVYARNYGAAWSLFADMNATWRVPFFVFISVVALVVIVLFLRLVETRDRWMTVALACVAGGAIGNFIDRLAYGFVIDFIDMYYQKWHWPTYNVADIFISTGVVMMALGIVFGKGTLSLHYANEQAKESGGKASKSNRAAKN
jgi:signal peptidase II